MNPRKTDITTEIVEGTEIKGQKKSGGMKLNLFRLTQNFSFKRVIFRLRCASCRMTRFCIWMGLGGVLLANDSKALLINPDKINGGTVYLNEKQEYRVELRNQTRNEIWIQSVESDCDCLQILEKPRQIKGEDKVVLRLFYLSKNEVAALVKVRILYWAAGRSEELILMYSADVMERASNKVEGDSTRRIVPATEHFQITAEAILNRSDCIVIDVRPSDRFQKVRIPGSLNLPLFAVKTKSILRSRALVLVGDGDFEGALLAEAVAMEAAGYREVKVLMGGISAWEQNGGALERLQAEASSTPKIEQGPGRRILVKGFKQIGPVGSVRKGCGSCL